MTKNNERVGDRDSHWEFSAWEFCAALLPFRIGAKNVPAGTGYRGSNYAMKVEWGQPKPVDEAVEAGLYEALLELPWLKPRVRVAVMRTLGRSQRDAEVGYCKGATAVYKLEVDETAARMRANGERPPRGDIRAAAIEKVAERIGMKPEALAKRLQRYRD
jgi:hypothetical protein